MVISIELRILAVEDSPGLADNIKSAVVKVADHYKVQIKFDEATNYNDAFRKINSSYYDVVILDHNLPYQDPDNEVSTGIGYKLIELIRKRNKHTLIIGTSSEHEDGELEKKYGKVDFFLKGKHIADGLEDQLSRIIKKLEQEQK